MKTKPEPRTVYVAIAVIEKSGRYLICRRHAHQSFGGYWEFPGGKRENGESWESCLRRELQEELGVCITRVKAIGKLYHRLGRRQAFFRVFSCVLKKGQRPRPLDAQAIRWVKPERLLRHRFPPANRPLIRQLAADRNRRVVRLAAPCYN